jgi:hypothetical protein
MGVDQPADIEIARGSASSMRKAYAKFCAKRKLNPSQNMHGGRGNK